MAAGGISQIMEQILRLIGGIGLALIVLGLGWGDKYGAAAIAFRFGTRKHRRIFGHDVVCAKAEKAGSYRNFGS